MSTLDMDMDKAKEATKKWADDTRKNPLPFIWLVSSVVSVVLPLLIFWVCRSRYGSYYKEYKDYYDDHPELRLGALVFVYLWTLVLFIIFVFLGRRFIMSGNTKDNAFLIILIMFGNLSFVAFILSLSNLHALDGHSWDGRFFSLFPSLLAVTFALWTLLCVIFTGAVIFVKFKIVEKGAAQAGHDAYHRQSDEETPVENDSGALA